MTAAEWIAVAAVAVSAAAWVVAVCGLGRQRRHDRLSVRPHLVFEVHLRRSLGIFLANRGLGPAILDPGVEVQWREEGAEWIPWDAAAWLAIAQSVELEGRGVTSASWAVGDPLEAGSCDLVLGIEEHKADDDDLVNSLAVVLQRLRFRAASKSMYEEEQPPATWEWNEAVKWIPRGLPD
jgi:hypothetical protein